MVYSMPGFPVVHHLPEFVQTHVIESVMPSNHLVLCRPLLLPSIFPSIRVFSSKSALCIRWPSIGASAWVLPMNIQDWFPLVLTGLISLQSKGLSRIFSSTTIQKHHFNSILPRFVIAFLPRSKPLLISWLPSPSAVILEPKKVKSVTVSTVSPSICHEVMGPDTMILVFWVKF